MEWESAVIEWINCVKLTEEVESIKNISCIENLSNGRFFADALTFLSGKPVDCNSSSEIFSKIELTLQDVSYPQNWINFLAAADGDKKEILKIATLLVIKCYFLSQAKLLLENRKVAPATTSATCISPAVASPQIYISSPFSSPCRTPTKCREILDVEKRQAQLIKQNKLDLLAKTANIFDLESRNSELELQLGAMRNELKSKENILNEARERMKEVEQNLEETLQNLNVKRQRLEETKGKLAETRAELERINSENMHLTSEVNLLKLQQETTAEEITSHKITSQLQSLLDDFRKDNEETAKTVNESVAEFEKEKLKFFERERETYKERINEANAKHKKEQEEYAQCTNDLSKKLDEERSKVLMLEINVDELKGKLEINSIKLEESDEILAEVKQMLNKANSVNDELTEHVGILNDQLDDLEKLAEEASSANCELSVFIKEKKKLLKKAEEDKREIALKFEKTNSDLMAKDKEFTEFEKRSKLEFTERLRKKENEIKHKLARIVTDQMEQDRLEAKKTISHLEQNIEDLKREHAKLRCTNIELNTKLFGLNDSLQKKSLENEKLRTRHDDMLKRKLSRDASGERVNEIQRRNARLPLHLRSCYPCEDLGRDEADEKRLSYN